MFKISIKKPPLSDVNYDCCNRITMWELFESSIINFLMIRFFKSSFAELESCIQVYPKIDGLHSIKLPEPP